MNANQEHTPEQPDWSDAAIDAEPVLGQRVIRRIGWIAVAVLIITLLTVLPPLLNVSRYQRRVAQGISDSIGRPVHFDEIHLHLLPLPGLTIQNFVVEEDPAFGFEPAMRANVVEVRLRLASLWRRRIEVSHIRLEAPSINLVRRDDGRWSLQGIVTQAGYLQNAPTAQGRAGAAPRFPYIEATEARLNIKEADNKLPWSLVDAKLALWLPDQNEWRVRLQGRPVRTDTDVSDVGTLELEGSLGRGATGVMHQPLAISGRWASTPLGEAAKLFVGHDTGFRGAASAEIEIRGTPAHMHLSSDMRLHNLRRSDFVPRLPMSLNAHCEAEAMGIVHALHNVRCGIPTAQSAGLFDGVFRSGDEHLLAAPDVLSLEADIPNLLDPATATATADLKKANPGYFLNWLRVLSSRIPESVVVDGSVALHASLTPAKEWTFDATCTCALPSPQGLTAPAMQDWNLQFTHSPNSSMTQHEAAAVNIRAFPLTRAPEQNGEQEPLRAGTQTERDSASITGQITRDGATLQYSSPGLARYAARLVPPLGDGLPADAEEHALLESVRKWAEPQQWTVVAIPAPKPVRRHRR